jgi:Zn-dependent protease with chaperone function
MTLHLIQSGLLAMLFFAGLTAGVSAAFYPKVRNRLTRMPCQLRSTILTFWLLSPAFFGFLLAFSGLLPAWTDNHQIATEHCSSHTNRIAHLCWFDPIVHLSDRLWAVGISVLASIMLWNASKGIHLLVKHWHFQTTLRLVGQPDPQRGVFRIASEQLFVFSCGFFKPYAFISSRLTEQLSAKQLDVVLAHEQAHCRRRDILKRLLLSLTALFHFPAARRQLQADWELAQEQICDDAALQKAGDRLFVAETIIHLARQLNTRMLEQDRIGVTAFNGSHIDIRIHQLLDPPQPMSRYAIVGAGLLFIVFFIGLLALTMPLHHLL